ncbi:hypothetical protein GP486_000927 [Trichoglossum hirsutum]|uniref:Nuclease S1 n=1 Tax=Trichoglossum hirsutum TaxID=265104 RepID=A0A9P8LHM3_9PEZI|nr:hypothetical protein GP486_000927 [Trichoglossum hirsutum]
MRTHLTAFLSLSALVPLGACWGTLGHRTVAYVAQKRLSSAGASYLAQLLQDEDVSDAALWADQIKRQRPQTSGWHYIDAHDDPPNKCGVNYKRDCTKTGCVVSAIVDMTSRANDPSLSFDDHQEALKFLLHFIGDIHQPLHTEAEAKGGNGIKVLFGRRHTELHAIWDTDILVKHEGGKSKDEPGQASDWADRLVEAGGDSSWLKCADLGSAEKCALVWAGEANEYVCGYVLKDGVDGVTGGRDLSEDYYDGAVPIVDELVAKAGFRLGEWINELATERAAMVARGVVFEGPKGRSGGKEQEVLEEL